MPQWTPSTHRSSMLDSCLSGGGHLLTSAAFHAYINETSIVYMFHQYIPFPQNPTVPALCSHTRSCEGEWNAPGNPQLGSWASFKAVCGQKNSRDPRASDCQDWVWQGWLLAAVLAQTALTPSALPTLWHLLLGLRPWLFVMLDGDPSWG